MNPIDYFDQGWRKAPSKVCFKSDTGQYTYDELRVKSLKVANAMRDLGIQPGTHVGILSNNCIESVIAWLGAYRAGATYVPINPRNAAADNIEYINVVECKALLFHSDFSDQVERIRNECKTLEFIINIDADQSSHHVMQDWLLGDTTEEPSLSYEPNHIATIPGTGGTTGLPKGVCLSNRAAQMSIANALTSLPIHKDTVYLAAAPVTHAAGGMLLPVFSQGGTVVLHSGVDPEKLLRSFEKDKITLTYLPPTALYMLLAHPSARTFDYSTLEAIVIAAAPLSVTKMKLAAEIFGPVMAQLYGQTECAMMATYMPPEGYFNADGSVIDEQRLRSCGRPTTFVRVAILDEAGNALPAGEVGEIALETDMKLSEYYHNTAETTKVLKDGRLLTGDVGYVDDKGYVYIIDRAKDMVITGGFNVYPAEVEQVIMRHSSVAECAVIGVADEKWGERVHAVVVLHPQNELSAEDLIRYCKDTLGSVKTPKTVDFVRDLPRSAVGKVLKRTLREQYGTKALAL